MSSYGIFNYKPGLSKPETNHRISKRNEGDNLSIEDGETFYISNSKTEPNFSQKYFIVLFLWQQMVELYQLQIRTIIF